MGKIHEDYAALLTLCKTKPQEEETKQKVNEFLKFIETCELATLDETEAEYKQTLLA